MIFFYPETLFSHTIVSITGQSIFRIWPIWCLDRVPWAGTIIQLFPLNESLKDRHCTWTWPIIDFSLRLSDNMLNFIVNKQFNCWLTVYRYILASVVSTLSSWAIIRFKFKFLWLFLCLSDWMLSNCVPLYSCFGSLVNIDLNYFAFGQGTLSPDNYSIILPNWFSLDMTNYRFFLSARVVECWTLLLANCVPLYPWLGSLDLIVLSYY